MPVASGRPLRSSTATIAILLLSATSIACRKVEPAGRVDDPDPVDLIAGLGGAEIVRPETNYVQPSAMVVGGERRPGLLMHPPSRVTFPPLRLALESRLVLSYGISDEVWGQPGDGVRFSVYAIVRGREPVRVFSAYVDPKSQASDRGWRDAVVQLGMYSGQDVSLALETDPGPVGNLAWDWAFWSRAEVQFGPN